MIMILSTLYLRHIFCLRFLSDVSNMKISILSGWKFFVFRMLLPKFIVDIFLYHEAHKTKYMCNVVGISSILKSCEDYLQNKGKTKLYVYVRSLPPDRSKTVVSYAAMVKPFYCILMYNNYPPFYQISIWDCIQRNKYYLKYQEKK